MNVTSHSRLPAAAWNAAGWLLPMIAALLLAACGGGATTATTATESASCDPADPSTADACGTVVIALTDDEGDFLEYSVDVVSLTLETADGRRVETLPRATRVDFTRYVELAELVGASRIPPATYVAGAITLDYADAAVAVEAGDAAKRAIVTDADGNPLQVATKRIALTNRDALRVTRGGIAFVQLDFDLGASHRVDTGPTPAIAASAPVIVAEIDPVDEKSLRVRGRLLDVDIDHSLYVIDLRPFHDRDGDFGRLRVHTDAATEFDVDGRLLVGSEGLRALAAAGPGTPTVAAATRSRADHSVHASRVLAGSSVPGHDRDAVTGNVIARDGNRLTVRGSTILPTDRRPHFHDDVVVVVGENTRVIAESDRLVDAGIGAISVGQRITAVGELLAVDSSSDSPTLTFDATDGAVRLHVTRIAGIARTIVPGQTDIVLHAIDRRRAAIFDFAGTGPSAGLDADPDNYEIATGNLTLAAFAEGRPLVAYGFPTPFGMAPPDFSGRTVVDFSGVGSVLGVGWGAAGSASPFASIGADGLLLDISNPDLGERHHVRHGPLVIDLTGFDSDTRIVPRESDRRLFWIAVGDALRQYADFAEFAADLNEALNTGQLARGLHGHGRFDSAANTFTAYKLGIVLVDPS